MANYKHFITMYEITKFLLLSAGGQVKFQQWINNFTDNYSRDTISKQAHFYQYE